jgi:hypothetical protein
MTAEQAVGQYVGEILRVVGQRADMEVAFVESARRAMRRQGHGETIVELAGEIAGEVFRRRMWAGEA